MRGKGGIRLAIAWLLVCSLAGCGSRGEGTILPDSVALREGDLVLRCGNGMMSRAVVVADNGGAYSHIGIVADSAGQLMVVHAVPDEPDFEGDVDRVKMESVAKFYAGVSAKAGAVLRYKDKAVARTAAQDAVRIYRKHTLFDHDYDASDTTKLYCCELIDLVFRNAGTPLNLGERHSFSLPIAKLHDVILPSDFLGCRDFSLVATF